MGTPRRVAASVTLGLILGLSGLACGSQCSMASAVPPVITVTNASTGQPICDASVRVISVYGESEDAGLSSVPWDAGASPCRYVWSDNVIDPYTVEVSEPGFQTATKTITPQETSCSGSGAMPVAQVVDIPLAPS